MKKYTFTYYHEEEKVQANNNFFLNTRKQEDCRVHSHLFFEFVYVSDGEAVHVLNDNERIIKKGCFWIMDYESVHCYKDTKNLTLINFCFLPEFIDDILVTCRRFDDLMKVCMTRFYQRHTKQEVVNRIFVDDDEMILSLLRRAQTEYEQRTAGYHEMVKCIFIEMLIMMTRRVMEPDAEYQSNIHYSELVENVREYVREHFSEKIVLGGFCKDNHYSMQYISKRYKEEVGSTITDYILEKRLEKGCELLKNSQLDIFRIAQEIGYEDVRTFNRIFKQKLAMTPREYRKQARARLVL